MKIEEKKKARELRRDGKSLNYISDVLKVSKSSASIWVRDILLTKEQEEELLGRSRHALIENNVVISQKARMKRLECQEDGRKKAQKFDSLHLSGCMLYWAEGWKRNNKNVVNFVNSDPYMIKVFMRFLLESLDVERSRITLGIRCYDNNGLSIENIENYWLEVTGLNRESLRKTSVNAYPISSKKKRKNILPYGVCSLNLNDTRIIQSIYGSIQEYGRFENKEWLG